MGVLNPNLKDPGATPGSAKGWTIASFCKAQRTAAFAPDPVRGVEDFDRWSDLVTVFPDGALVLAFFDKLPEGHEDFEEGWSPSAFVTELPEAIVDTCSFGDGAVEDLEAGWLTAPFAGAWGDVAAEAGMFDGVAYDGFEAWTAVVAATWTAGMFDATKTAESFEGTWTAMKSL